MIKKTVDVWICENHHEVLLAWNKYREKKCNVISLDYHTDTHDAFTRYSCAMEPDDNLVPLARQKFMQQYNCGIINLPQAVFILNNDEHVDFAIKSNMINKFFVIPLGRANNRSHPTIFTPNSFPLGFVPQMSFVDGKTQCTRENRHYNGERIIEYDYVCLPNCPRGPHDDDCLMDVARNSIDDSFLRSPIDFIQQCDSRFFENYILDIDLDYFRLKSSLSPQNREIISGLIRNAQAITIATEPHCFRPLDEQDPINSGYALCGIKTIINSIVCAQYSPIALT